MQKLYYHKCDDCLTAFSTDVALVDFCDCNGTVTLMGEVRGDKFVKIEDKPACDGRCTHASGPMCDCLCGGVNHGTGKMVKTVVVQGKVKAVDLSEEDVNRAHVYRRIRDATQVAFDEKFSSVESNIKSGIRVDYPLYCAFVREKRALEKAIGLRQHWPRIKALGDIYSKLKS